MALGYQAADAVTTPRQEIDQGEVRLARRLREARHDVAEVVLRERGLVVDRARQEALSERAEGHEADSQLFERRKDLVLRLAPPQRVLALQGRDRLNGVGAADGLHAGLRKPKKSYLALGDEVANGPGNLLDRDVAVDPVLIEEIDVVRSEPLERSLRDGADVLGAAVGTGPARFAEVAEFGGDHDLVAHRRKRLADNLLVGVGTVGLGRIEEGDAELVRLP